nr:Ger(x)C family spore germination protein [uncultured Bacillus sp.]
MRRTQNKDRLFLISLSLLLLLSLTGCWSSHEIEELSLAVGAAFDVGDETDTEKKLDDPETHYTKKNRITTTYQLVTAQGTNLGTKETGTKQQPYINISETGDSILQLVREISLRTDTPFNTTHMKTIVISEKLARKYSLEQLFNAYLRDNEFRPSSAVFISNGKASKTLESKKKGVIPAFELFGIIDNRYKTTRISPPVTLIKLESRMRSGTSFLIQNIVSANNEVKFAGAAVINGKTKKLIGFLNEEELEGVTWITGKGKGGLVKSYNEETGQVLIYEIESMKSNITSHVKGDKITSFDVKIQSKGRLSENWLISCDSSDNTFLKKAEESAEKEVKRLSELSLKKSQKEYKVDVAGFGNQLKIEHPKLWKKVKKDWDQTFSEIPIYFNVDLTITDYGTSGFVR